MEVNDDLISTLGNAKGFLLLVKSQAIFITPSLLSSSESEYSFAGPSCD